MKQGWRSQPLHATLSQCWRRHEDPSGKDRSGLAAPVTRLRRSGRLSSCSWGHTGSLSPQLTALVSRPLCRSLHCRSGRTGTVCCRGQGARCCGAGTAWSLWAPAAGSTWSAALNSAGRDSNMTFQHFQVIFALFHLNSAVCSHLKMLLVLFPGRISVPFTSSREEEGQESKWAAATKVGPCRTKNWSEWIFLKSLTCRADYQTGRKRSARVIWSKSAPQQNKAITTTTTHHSYIDFSGLN